MMTIKAEKRAIADLLEITKSKRVTDGLVFYLIILLIIINNSVQ